jgi:hypothetical protein
VLGEVPVRSLVERQDSVEVSRSPAGRRRTFLEAGDCGRIVAERMDCLLANVDLMGQYHMVPNATSLLKIGVGEHAGGVGERDELGGYLRRERLTPEEIACGSEPDTACTEARSVVRTNACGR